MKLWKRDCTTWTVREVNGEPWPGTDEEDETCHVNTHFATRAEAAVSLKAEAEAFVKLSARELERAKKRLSDAQEQCGEATVALSKAIAAALSEKRRDG